MLYNDDAQFSVKLEVGRLLAHFETFRTIFCKNLSKAKIWNCIWGPEVFKMFMIVVAELWIFLYHFFQRWYLNERCGVISVCYTRNWVLISLQTRLASRFSTLELVLGQNQIRFWVISSEFSRVWGRFGVVCSSDLVDELGFWWVQISIFLYLSLGSACFGCTGSNRFEAHVQNLSLVHNYNLYLKRERGYKRPTDNSNDENASCSCFWDKGVHDQDIIIICWCVSYLKNMIL